MNKTLRRRRRCHVVICWRWRRGSVVRTSVFGWRTFPTCAWSMVDRLPLCG